MYLQCSASLLQQQTEQLWRRNLSRLPKPTLGVHCPVLVLVCKSTKTCVATPRSQFLCSSPTSSFSHASFVASAELAAIMTTLTKPPAATIERQSLLKYEAFSILHMTLTARQRHPSSDPYIELTEGDSNTARREDASYDDEHKTGRGTVQGIMRTIQIDTIEEKVYAPKSTATNNFQVDVVTEVTSSGTRT